MVSKSKEVESEVTLNSGTKEIHISNLSIQNEEVYEFLKDKEEKEEWLKRAIIIGSVGLKNMMIGYNVDYVDKRFNQFLNEVEIKFKEQEKEIKTKIDETFDINKSSSSVAQLYKKIDETFDIKKSDSAIAKLTKILENYFDDKNGVVKQIIDETFSVKKKDSPMSKFMDNLSFYFDEENGILNKTLTKNLDITKKDTPLGMLAFNLDNYFDERRGVVKKLLDQSFDFNNKESAMHKFSELLEKSFDVDKGTIKKLLDPSKQDSPINQLKEEIVKNIKEVKTLLEQEQAMEDIIQKTTLKGTDFQDDVEAELQAIVNPYGDMIEDVSTSLGRSGKAGDFLISVDGNKKDRIAIECKDGCQYTCKKINQEISKIISNRNAKFTIFLFKKQNQIPKEMQPVRIAQNSMIVSYENNGLYFAYRIARMFIENEVDKQNQSIPIDKIQIEIQTIQDQSRSFNTMMKKTTEIKNASIYINDELERFHKQLENSLLNIERYLRPAIQ
ncbi:MAG: hypothetical protein WA144_12695 [Candidatus Methanoperedens sp.]